MHMQMPALDGPEATPHICAVGEVALLIAASVVNAFGEDCSACLAAGLNDHVAKPVDREQLHAALLHWLSSPGSDLQR